MGLGDFAQAQARFRTVETAARQAAEDIAPQAFLAVAVGAKGTGVGALYFDAIHWADISGVDNDLADVLGVLPVFLAVAVVVL